MRDGLRFPISGPDQGAISDIEVFDTDFSAVPEPGDIPAQSLRLEFTTPSTPEKVKAHPLFVGALGFLPQATAGLPSAADVTFTPNESAAWPTIGRLFIVAETEDQVADLSDAYSDLSLVPNVVWYDEIELPEAFLFETLLDHLEKATIRRDGTRIRPSHPTWRSTAVSAFLAGRYRPFLPPSPTDPVDDISEQYPWPVISDAGPETSTSLTISLARSGVPQDDTNVREISKKQSIRETVWLPAITYADPSESQWSAFDPCNPRFGTVPARVALAAARDHIVDGGLGMEVADAALGDVPLVRNLRFTRTYLDDQNDSVYFPRHTVTVETDSDLIQQRMPNHGVMWIPVTSAAEPLVVSLEGSAFSLQTTGYTTGSASWISGSVEDAWRIEADVVPITLGAGEDHVMVRIPFRHQLILETGWPSDIRRCTYMAIRRFTRALVDHRITGGMLTQQPRARTKRLRKHMMAAWDGEPSRSVDFIRNRPAVRPRDASGANALLRGLRSFFPDPSFEALELDSDIPEGDSFYWVWQSAYGRIYTDAEAYYDMNVGYGGVEAALKTGLGELVANPTREGDETVDQRRARLAGAIVGLQRPALLQFWENGSEYDDLRNAATVHYDVDALRHPDDEPHSDDATNQKRGKPIGHSLLYIATVTGEGDALPSQLLTVDHHGPRFLEIKRDGLGAVTGVMWGEFNPQIWIAASLSDGLR